MEIRSLDGTEPFTTKDGSTIRELHHTALQSLAEASLPAGAPPSATTTRVAEEIYFLLSGEGELEIDGELRTVGPGDAALIPPRRPAPDHRADRPALPVHLLAAVLARRHLPRLSCG